MYYFFTLGFQSIKLFKNQRHYMRVQNADLIMYCFSEIEGMFMW